jgi:hypothetical protein
VKDLVTGVVGQRDTVSISEHFRLVDTEPLGDLAGILLGLFIVFANMTHPIMCGRATDQVKEISGHAGSTATSGACSKGGKCSDDVSPRSFDGGPRSGLIRFDRTGNRLNCCSQTGPGACGRSISALSFSGSDREPCHGDRAGGPIKL